MLRILLTVLLPVVLPIILYLAYVKYVRPRPANDTAAWAPPLGLWLVLGAAVLLIGGMLALGLSRGVPPGTKLIAPHMENGEIVPSRRQDQVQ